MKEKVKQEVGSITLFVLVALLFFAIVLISSYMLVKSKANAQLEEVGQIKSSYGEGIDSLADVYNYLKATRGEYTITYNANTTDTVKDMPTVTATGYISELQPSRSGYIFIGWASEAAKKEAEYMPGDEYTQKQNITLYAIWISAINQFNYTGQVATYIVPKEGKYKLETWGAQGGYRSSSTYGGLGGYSAGSVNLKKGDIIYIAVGGAGNNGGFNGGGSRTTYKGGGGATDIRIGQNNLYARVIVAGGGGSDGATTKKGMHGGGTSGGTTSESYGSGGDGGTQTAGGNGSSSSSATKGTFGIGGQGYNASSGYAGAGGGGWYGGAGSYPDGSGDDDRGGGGGSGYIYTSSTAGSYPSGCLLNSKYYLLNAQTMGGDSTMPTQNGTSTMTGNTGDGFAKITYIP